MVVNTEALPPLGDAERAPEGGEVQVSGSGWRLALASFMENRLAVAGVGILVFFVLFCWVGPLVYRTNQSTTTYNTFLPPSGRYPLGTDPSGFNVLGRLMVGGQAALEIGFFAAAIAIVIGSLYGAIAGLIGGEGRLGRLIDGLMMRIVDAAYSIPFLFVVLILASNPQFPATVLSLSLIIGIFSWLVPSRLVRGEVLSLRVRDFVAAAKVMGASRTRLIGKHLLPNALGVVIVNVTFQVADAILAISYLGFLGFGLHFPQVSWGDMLSNGTTYLEDGYWWLIYPAGICLILVVMAFNFIGDGLRDAVDVRLRRR
jgi:ABC-type dipeptide/oligopeptide/nickel transport system permease subunit